MGGLARRLADCGPRDTNLIRRTFYTGPFSRKPPPILKSVLCRQSVVINLQLKYRAMRSYIRLVSSTSYSPRSRARQGKLLAIVHPSINHRAIQGSDIRFVVSSTVRIVLPKPVLI